MSKQLPNIDGELGEWIGRQKIFFVATAPSDLDQRINMSPKGGDSFRVLGPLEVAYQDYTGSGAETAAHLRDNGRIVVMFCAFEGAPKVVRLHGIGSLITPEDERFDDIAALFPPNPGTRAFVHIALNRVSSSCGFSVPFFAHQGPRETLDKWAAQQGPEKLQEYRALKNLHSIDGLPAFEKPL